MRISEAKKEKIKSQILDFLYSNNPRSFFTSHIAQEIARDEEFIKKLLLELLSKELVVKIDKNSQGKKYLQRARWKLSEKVYFYYKNNQ